jgi:hypothetical protein
LDEDFQADGNMLPMEVNDWAPNPEQRGSASGRGKVLTKTVQRKLVGLKRLERQAPVDAVQIFIDSRAVSDSASVWFRCSRFRLSATH